MSEVEPVPQQLDPGEMELLIDNNQRLISTALALVSGRSAEEVTIPVEMKEEIAAWYEEYVQSDGILDGIKFQEYLRCRTPLNRDKHLPTLRALYDSSYKNAGALQEIYAKFFPDAEV